MTKVSIIVPSYKPGEYIFECLDSIYRQTLSGAQYEVVIVLNGCNDPYRTQIENYISSHEDKCIFRLIQTDTPGVSNARNIGIEECQGEYITFVDDDDVISERYLEELLKVSGRYSIGCSNSFYFSNSISDKGTTFVTSVYYRVLNKPYNIVRYRQFMSPVWCKLIHREIIGGTRFPTNIRLSEDCVFCFKLMTNKIVLRLAAEDAIYYQRYRVGSAMRVPAGFSKELSEFLKIEAAYFKHWLFNIRSVNFLFYMSRAVAGTRCFFNRLRM